MNDYVSEDGEVMHPPVAPVFWGFRVMVGTGLAMLVLSWTAVWFFWRRGDLPRPLAQLFVPMVFSGWIATIAGWYVTEIGRQPWLVTGVLGTTEAVGSVTGSMVLSSLLMYLATYVMLLIAYVYVLVRLALTAARSSVNNPQRPGVALGGTTLPAGGRKPVSIPAE